MGLVDYHRGLVGVTHVDNITEIVQAIHSAVVGGARQHYSTHTALEMLQHFRQYCLVDYI